MKKTILTFTLLICSLVVVSQTKYSLQFLAGTSYYNKYGIKSHIPYISGAIYKNTSNNFLLGTELSIGNRQKIKNPGFNIYTFKSIVFKLLYQKVFLKKLQLSGGIGSGVDIFTYSELRTINNNDLIKDEAMFLNLLILPEININYLFKNNSFLGLFYKHNVYLDGSNSPNFGIKYGIKF